MEEFRDTHEGNKLRFPVWHIAQDCHKSLTIYSNNYPLLRRVTRKAGEQILELQKEFRKKVVAILEGM